VDRIIADLSSLSQSLGELSDLKEAVSRAKADLDSMNVMREQAESQMREAQAGLTRAQIQNQKQFENDMFNKQGQLKSLTERVAALEERAKELSDEVGSKGAQLGSIENSLNDARRKLAS
jgi:predicted  nucleic acid-binding Zn-ribbon protein